MATTLLERIDTVLAEGRATAELVRRFLATHALPEPTATGGDPLPELLGSASQRVELSTGYRYLFENQPGLIERIAAMVEHERQSGRFLRFQLALQAGRGPVALDVSGPGPARTFLAAIPAPDPERANEFAQKCSDELRAAWIPKAG